MKRHVLIGIFSAFLFTAGTSSAGAQCSICTKSASQLGTKPGKGLNAGIMYLMLTPLTVAGYLGFRWWRREKHVIAADEEA